MNVLKFCFGIAFFTLLFSGCKKDIDNTSFINTASNPAKLGALFTITQNNTGLVTITPNGEGVTSFDIYFGDATTAPVKVIVGNSTQHNYQEGVYQVKIVGYNISGKTSETTQSLTVSYRKPENVVVTAITDVANNFKVNLSATALYETYFKVTFGDVANEIPQSFLEGDTLSHTYKVVGNYTIKLVAYSGGKDSTIVTKNVSIINPVLLPITFESSTIDYTFTNFDGGNTTIIANPQANGINTSSKVAKMVKNAGQPWGGSFIAIGNPIDFTTNKIFRMKVFSPRVGAKVLLKVENAADVSINYEKEVTTTLANAWEDLAFDYSAINASKAYNHIVLIFDNGTIGDGTANYTFLIDDIRQTNVLPASKLSLPITFDDLAFNYGVTDFGGDSTVDGVDPTNSANKIKVTTKATGAQTWAGTTLGSSGASLGTPIPFTSTATKMSVRVYSPAAGIPVRLKTEQANNSNKSVETEAITTTSNTWETLTFDFNNHSAGTTALNLSNAYDKISIFFDFGTVGSGKVFRWDDVKFVSGSGGGGSTVLALPIDFESSAITYSFTDFGGGAASAIANTQIAGINTSAKVGKMVKSNGFVYGGSLISLPSPIDFSTKKTMKMKVFSPRVGAKVLLKVENLTDGNVFFEKEVLTTKANDWEQLTFDYSAIPTTKTYQKVVLIFDNGTMGDGSANFTFLFDDISLN